MVRTFILMRGTDDLGYDPKRVITAQLQLQAPRYAEAGAVRQMQAQLLERIRAQPMVEASALEHPEFLGAFVGNSSRVTLEGEREPVPLGRGPRHGFAVSPDYFRLMEIPLQAGRSFTPADEPAAPRPLP